MRSFRLAVPLFLLVAAQVSGALRLGPERMIAPPRYGVAFDSQVIRTLASDGTDFLAVWREESRGREGFYTAVMNEQGVTRPTPSRALLRGNVGNALVVWAGDAYQLVWADRDARATMMARLNRDGVMISQPVVIAAPASPQAIAWNGRQTLVVLYDSTTTLTAVLLGPSGVERAPFPIAPVSPIAVSATAAGSGFVVVWAETIWEPVDSTVRVARVSADGTVGQTVALLDHEPVRVSEISTATDGERIGIAFNSGVMQSRLQRYTLDVDTLAFTRIAQPAIANAHSPQVIATADGLVAGYLYFDRGRVELMIAPFDGTKPRTIDLGPLPHGGDLRLATSGRAIGAIWHDVRPSTVPKTFAKSIVGTTLDARAVTRITDVVPLATAADSQGRPVVAPAGSEALVVWFGAVPEGGPGMLARRVDATGNAIDAQPLVIASAGSDSEAAAVFTGELWIVAWSPRDEIYMRRIARNGTLIDAAPIHAGAGAFPHLAATNENTIMVVAVSGGSSIIRLSRSGERVGAPLFVRDVYPGSLASNGRELLLVWEEGTNWRQFPSPDLRDVRGLRLDASGAPIDAAPIDIVTGPEDTGRPQVGSDGTDFLIAYQHSHEHRDVIRTKKLLRNGTLDGVTARQEGTLIDDGDGYPISVAARAQGGGYLVAFGRFGFTTPSSVWTTPVDGRGVPTDGPSRLARSDSESISTSIGSSGGHTWAAYARTEPSADIGNVMRVFVRMIDGDVPSRRRTARQ